ncbi:MAG: PilN domain-containing protein [Patescibacteria group bacterium]|nr:PilN domain-containing protein [Patescibacteria group bacterium]
MADVNLLPDELRGREAAERRRLSKTPKVVEYTLTNPPRPEEAKLQHGGSGAGRPEPQKRPLTPLPEALPPAPVAPPPPPSERIRIVRPHGIFGGLSVPIPKRQPPAPPHKLPEKVPAPPPVTAPPSRHLEAAEAAKLAEIVKREVHAVERDQLALRAAAVHPKPHRRSFGQWLASWFSRPPKPAPKVMPQKPAPVLPPAPRPLPTRTVTVEIKTAQKPVLPVPKPHRRSFWQWLSSWFASKPKPVVKPPLPKPSVPLPSPPVKPLPPVVVAVKTPLKPAPKPAMPRRPRRSLWQWLLGLFRRKPKPAKPPIVPQPSLPVPPVKPQPVVAAVKYSTLPLPPPPPKPQPMVAEVKPALPKPAPLPPPPLKSAPPPPPPPPLRPPTGKTETPPPVPPKPVAGHAVHRPPKTIAINLIPEEFARHPELYLSRKFLLYLVAVGLSTFVIVVISQIIGWYQYRIGNEIAVYANRIKLYQEQIDQYQEIVARSQTLQQELDSMGNLLSHHYYWTQVFNALERTTIDDVYFASFASASDGKLQLAAHGKDYSSVARQLVAFRQASDLFAGVSITGATAVVDVESDQVLGVNFSVSLTLRPEVFFKPLTAQP